MPADQFFDLQVNGYAGVDFNQEDLSADALRRACEQLAADGVDGILATIITEQIDVMCRRVANLARLRKHDELAKRMIVGLHIEGPFLSPEDGYRGAHPRDAICPADPDAMRRLLDAGAGSVRLVTLAPECDAQLRVTRMLAAEKVVISAGHTDASLEQLRAACDAGLSMFTHLGNGCPMQMHRHDNIIQRALSLSDRLWCCFIADGVHVPMFALANYIGRVGYNRSIIVTDAMPAAGLGPGRYTLGRWDLLVGEDLAAWAPDRSHLIGSAITMRQSAERLLASLGCSDEQLRSLISVNPRRAIGLR